MAMPPYEDNEAGLGEERIPGQYQNVDSGEEHIIGGNDFGELDIAADDVEIENTTSRVASAPAKNILIIVILVVISAIFLYKVVFQESDKTVAEKQLKAEIASQPTTNAQQATQPQGSPQIDIGVVDTPELPTLEANIPSLPPPIAPMQILQPEIPSPPPAVAPELPAPEPVKVEEPTAAPVPPPQPAVAPAPPAGPSPEEIARTMAKRRTGMLIMNGGGMPSDVVSGKNNPAAAGKSSAPSVTATKVDDLSLMILQGKMIDAVLETTLNTDLPGNLRAVISRDIYAEAGKNILIPRGSRLIGTYNTGVQPGQRRVMINWGRVIRPDGVDIDIASSGTDQLGRAGMTGFVDNKYFEMFSNSFMVSAVSIGSSLFLNKVQKAQTSSNSTTSNPDGSVTSTQTGNGTDLQVLEGVKGLTDQANKIASRIGETNPTIIINQGARIKVFVNKDLIFPASVVSNVRSIN